jgi:hypothetical protein
MAALLSGCGGTTHKQQQSIPAATTHASTQTSKPPAHPIYANCGTSAFTAPQASPIGSAVPPIGWLVTYVPSPKVLAHPQPGQTTNVTLAEYAPRPGHSPKLTGAKEITVAGRQISFHNRTAKTMYGAAWQTDRVRYTALADGATPDTLKQIIACLP